MNNLVVVDNPDRWPIKIPDVSIVAARSYLSNPQHGGQPGTRVFNLCRSYRYQSIGYYVSLLALARGHKPVPSIRTIQDMKTAAISRPLAEDIVSDLQRLLRPLKSKGFTLSIYFGKNVAKRYDPLASRLFRTFPAPLLRAEFSKRKHEWRLENVRPIGAGDIPESHRDFVIQAARDFFARKRLPARHPHPSPYALAILVNRTEQFPPSNKRALELFAAAGRRADFDVEFIERGDFNRLAQFDALFIRETTYVDHHTYRFARRAATEGLVVLDDPESIVRCTNKVYLAELLSRSRVATPRTVIVHRDNRDAVARGIGYPCVVKKPDSSYSQGVVKMDTAEQFLETVEQMLERTDLLIAQEFVPTEFDWRIGVLDRQPLFACKYYMVKKHWQIYKAEPRGIKDGHAEAVAVQAVPHHVVRLAVRATRLIGDGLYGVDLKQFGRKVVVMEINDNPSIDAGVEDGVLGKALYQAIMDVFRRRIDSRRPRPMGVA